MGTLFTALGAAAALAGTDIIPVHQGGPRALGLTGAQLLTYVGGSYVAKTGAQSMAGPLAIASGTLTASAPALNITQTWTTGAAFTGAVMNITDTSSTAGSLFQDWQVGGVSKLNIKKDGSLTWGANARIESDTAQISITHVGSGRTWASFRGYTTGLTFNTESGVVWCSSTNATAGTQDLFLVRDAAATLAQRNGTTQQTFRLYNTYTSGSVYQRLTLTGVANTSVNITAEELGTGSANIDIVLTPAGTGSTLHPVGTFSKPGIGFIGFTGTGMFPANSGANVVLSGSGLPVLNVAATYCGFPAAAVVGWGSAGSAGANPSDVAFARNAAGIVEVCSGTAGTWRDLKLRNLLNTEYHQMTEMTAPSAPATNSVRIYAEDNGAGKTRLMALFATGSAVQLGIEP